MRRFTLVELREDDTRDLLAALLVERRLKCTNVYSPVYVEITKLINYVEELPAGRLHDKTR